MVAVDTLERVILLQKLETSGSGSASASGSPGYANTSTSNGGWSFIRGRRILYIFSNYPQLYQVQISKDSFKVVWVQIPITRPTVDLVVEVLVVRMEEEVVVGLVVVMVVVQVVHITVVQIRQIMPITIIFLSKEILITKLNGGENLKAFYFYSYRRS